jgi:hypothetical protein
MYAAESSEMGVNEANPATASASDAAAPGSAGEFNPAATVAAAKTKMTPLIYACCCCCTLVPVDVHRYRVYHQSRQPIL